MRRLRLWWSAPVVPEVPEVAVLLPQPLRGEVVRLREADRSTDAVRLVREQTALGLLPAYLAVQAAADRLPPEEPPREEPGAGRPAGPDGDRDR